MKRILLAGAAALAMSSAAFAETAVDRSMSGDRTAAADLSANLRQAGFTDVKIVPDSFLVQAKDRSGNPVTMFITPNAMEVVTAQRTVVGRSPSEPVISNERMAARADSSAMFATVRSRDDLTSKVVGLDVYNNANQDIGKIKDVAFDARGVQAYIVAVGGFLGMGDHYVAVKPSAVNISHDANNNTWHAMMNTDADQLKAAPEYKYSSND